MTDAGHRCARSSRPAAAASPLPAVVVVGWLSCDSVEAPYGPQDGFAELIRRVMTQSGAVVMRVDKPGVGDSEGIACADLDFHAELAAYRAAFRSAACASLGRCDAHRSVRPEQRRRHRTARARGTPDRRLHRRRGLGEDVVRAHDVHAPHRGRPSRAIAGGDLRSDAWLRGALHALSHRGADACRSHPPAPAPRAAVVRIGKTPEPVDQPRSISSFKHSIWSGSGRQ